MAKQHVNIRSAEEIGNQLQLAMDQQKAAWALETELRGLFARFNNLDDQEKGHMGRVIKQLESDHAKTAELIRPVLMAVAEVTAYISGGKAATDKLFEAALELTKVREASM